MARRRLALAFASIFLCASCSRDLAMPGRSGLTDATGPNAVDEELHAPRDVTEAEALAPGGGGDADVAVIDVSVVDVPETSPADANLRPFDATTTDIQPVDIAIACSPANCDDDNPCTGDTCTSAGVCAHLATSGACDDGNSARAGRRAPRACVCLARVQPAMTATSAHSIHAI